MLHTAAEGFRNKWVTLAAVVLVRCFLLGTGRELFVRAGCCHSGASNSTYLQLLFPADV
jgi:hypothetical protein